MAIERRFLAPGEVRADIGSRQLAGYAARFNVEAEIGGFFEVIKPGAFAASLAGGEDIAALADHDQARLLGRRSSGTLSLQEDESGLSFVIRLPDTTTGRDTLELARRGDLAGCSFGFTDPVDAWRDQRHRELRSVHLGRGLDHFRRPARLPANLGLGALRRPDTREAAAGGPRARRPLSEAVMALGGLWRRLFRRTEPERRFSPAEAWYGGAPYYGPTGSTFFAENLASVTSAITVISRTIGSLPWRIYRRTDKGRLEVDDHPIARLLLHPDGEGGIWSLPDMAEWWIGQTLLLGNAVLAIEDDGAGRPVRLRPIPWAQSNPQILADGLVVFNVSSGGFSPWWPGHMPVRVASDDVLWLRDRPDANGVFGRSALSRCPEVLSLAAGAQTFAATTFNQGAKLSGVLLHPGKLSKEAGDRVAQSWRDTHAGPMSAGRVAILEEGLSFSALSMTLEDAELLASRKFQTEEVARLFNIPLPILNVWDHSTFTNSDTASQWFAQLCLSPWVARIEAEFSRTLFNDPDFRLEIDLSGLLRGNFATRIQSEINLVRSGVLTPNEVRLAEGWPALAGADKLQAQAVGGRPSGTGDGEGDSPAPGAGLNGAGRPNGAAVQ